MNNDVTGLADVSNLADRFNVTRLFFETEIDSTNDWAIQMAESIAGNESALFLANRQTAGRGRGNHRWHSGDGSLLFTLIPESRIRLRDERRQLMPMAVACGVCQALESHEIHALIKWPNDIILKDRKLGGILIETTGIESRPVIGCGLNVSNDLGQVPGAISLEQASGSHLPIADLCISIVNSVVERLNGLVDDPDPVVEYARKHDWLKGRDVVWTQNRISLRGLAAGLGDRGGLVLNVGGTLKEVCFGSVRTLENPAP